MIGDNAAPLADWQMPARCCGTWSDGNVCRICSNYIAAYVPDSTPHTLGEN